MTRWMLVASLLLVACHASLVPALHKPDGSWHLQCGSALDACVQRADELCKGRGYVILSGASRRKLLGAELGQGGQVEVREAELDIACADRRGDLPKVIPADSASPSSTPLPLPSSAPTPSSAPPPAP